VLLVYARGTTNDVAELRNRIYHFAQERAFCVHGLEPPLLVKCKKESKASSVYGARQFLAFTQSCKQIRLEYRPLWLRNSAIRVEFKDINDFIATFYPKVEDYQNAPKLFVISWDHEEDDFDEDALLDITPLLRLRASCPTFVASFRARRIIDGDLPDFPCEDCGHSIHCGCDPDCEHEFAVDNAFEELHMQYYYTDALDEILANANASWLKAIREDTAKAMRVECTIDLHSQHLSIYIRFRIPGSAPLLLDKKTMYKGGVQYLKDTGFLDLPSRRNMDFVLGAATGKYTRHLGGCMTLVPIYNQIEIPGSTVYKVKKTVKPATTSG